MLISPKHLFQLLAWLQPVTGLNVPYRLFPPVSPPGTTNVSYVMHGPIPINQTYPFPNSTRPLVNGTTPFANQTLTSPNGTAVLNGSISGDDDAAGRQLSSHPWVAACSSACKAAGLTARYCLDSCNAQADDRDAPPDPALVTYCAFMNTIPYLVPSTPAAQWTMERKIRSEYIVLGDAARSCFIDFQVMHPLYDWAPPQSHLHMPIECAEAKTKGTHFDKGQCVLNTPTQALWIDGPSIPHTSDALQAYEHPIEMVLDALSLSITAIIGFPPVFVITGGISDTSIRELASVLSHYRDLFWWSGVNHDLCYHNENSSHGYTRHDCDDNFLTDNGRLCDASGDAGRTWILQTDGVEQTRVVMSKTCRDWARLFHAFVGFDVEVNLVFWKRHFSFTKDAWEFANVRADYDRIDVVAARRAQHPAPLPQPVPLYYTLTAVSVVIDVRGDDKDFDTTGDVKLMLTNGRAGTVIAVLDIPKVEWTDQHTYAFNMATDVLFSHAELALVGVQPVMDFVTRGHDMMRFSMSVTLKFADEQIPDIEYCYVDQKVGNCGRACSLFSIGCPTNHCAWRGEEFPVGVPKASRCLN